jgi:hypothetical protein
MGTAKVANDRKRILGIGPRVAAVAADPVIP